MTLILTCLTEDCVFQVSDRRLTSFDPPHAVVDDESNKALMVDGRVVFGYTGISKINGENTDLWLARMALAATVQSNDMAKVCYRIQDEATLAFKRMSFSSKYKRHAFQAVGWFSNPEGPKLRPGIITLQNAIDPKTNGWLLEARSEFDLSKNFPLLGRKQFVLNSVGLSPTARERSAILQFIRKCVHRRTRQKEAVLEAMIISMRWLHFRYEPNSPIGPNIMAVSIPRLSVENSAQSGDFVALASGPLDNVATFLDVNITGRKHFFGPHFVCGGTMMTGFEAGPLERKTQGISRGQPT
jgi:hypothetical protein